MTKKYPGCNYDNKGRAYYQVEFPADENGFRKTKKSRKNQFGQPLKNLQEAWEEAVRLRNEFHQSNGILVDEKLTYSDYLDNIYLPYYTAKNNETTVETAKAPFKKIRGKVGRKSIALLNIRECESFRVFLLNSESEGYARKIWGNFKASMEYAYKLGYIKENPIRRLDSMPMTNTISDYWKPSDFKKVIQTFDLTDYVERWQCLLLWSYFMTGLRVNEMLCLTWDDISFSSKKLFVRKTFAYTKEKKWHIQEFLKTDAGYRTLELDEVTLQYMREWKEIQAKVNDKGYIFSSMGEPTYIWKVTSILKKHSKLAGVKKISGKGLRHSTASYLINVLNRDVLFVARYLGHSSPNVTLRTYAHWFNGSNEEISTMLTDSLKKSGLANVFD